MIRIIVFKATALIKGKNTDGGSPLDGRTEEEKTINSAIVKSANM
jgi:hypothetical protein